MPRASHALTTLLNQINEILPNRDRQSDGGIGDAAHASRRSDHNPDKLGVFHARDFDHDPDSNGLDCHKLLGQLLAADDSRTKYIIFHGKIYFPDGTARNYTGPNAHTGHLHLSVWGDNPREWDLPMFDKDGDNEMTPDQDKKLNDIHVKTTMALPLAGRPGGTLDDLFGHVLTTHALLRELIAELRKTR